MRCFTAIDIPANIRHSLTSVQSKLPPQCRLVKPEKLHITMQFYGDLSTGEIEKIKSDFDSVNLKKSKLAVRSLGAFPSTSRIHVIWAGVSGLNKVWPKSIDKPHITLARAGSLSQENREYVQGLMEKYKSHGFGSFVPDSIMLKSSVLGPSGPVYKDIFVREI